MSFLSNAQFLYLMGALWVLNGTIAAVAAMLAHELNERNFMFKLCVTSWIVGTGHIAYAFLV